MEGSIQNGGKAERVRLGGRRRFYRMALSVMLAVMMLASQWIFLGCGANYASDASEEGGASKTNVQEDGVDEADIVKVNAKGEIFKAQRDGVTISVMDPADGTIEVVTKKAVTGMTPLEMFLYKDYLIVINAKTNTGQIQYDNDFTFRFDYDTMVVNIYDLDVQAGVITLYRSDEFRGTYKTSRLTDDNLYLISNYSRDYGEAYVDYFDGAAEFDVTYKEDGYYSYRGFLIAKLNLTQPDGRYQTALYADSNVYDIYCSKYAFYVMKSEWFYSYRRGWGCSGARTAAYDTANDVMYFSGEITGSIDRISLDTLDRTGTAANFDGYSPDRFCLYDNGEYLFVANQKMFKRSKEDERGLGSWLYVFDAEMNEVAALGPLAPGETMYSARFDGDIAYIVTAERALMTVDPITFEPIPIPLQIFVDPLFKIDISDPLAPAYLGELEIEGFSTYMQTFGDGLLLGLGRGADGSELKISLFDTSNDMPEEVNSLLMANGAAEAETEARAILCEPDRNIFAFAARFDSDGMTEYGTLIFGLDDGCLSRTAFLPEIYPDTDYSRKRTRRVARIGDYLLAVSDGYIVSYPLTEVLGNGTAEPADIADTRIDTTVIWHTVSFVSEFGESYPARTVERGYFVTLPTPLDIEDLWEFGYWSEFENGTAYDDSRPVYANMTLYERWYKLPWRTVQFDLKLPAGVSNGTTETNYKYFYPPNPQVVEDGGRLTNQYNLYIGSIISGYKLTHWYRDDSSVPYDFMAPVNGSYTLYAYWKSIVTHTVVFDYNYPDGKQQFSTQIVENGTTADRPSQHNYYVYKGLGLKSVHYEFEYWYKDSPNTPYSLDQPITQNTTLKARWRVSN